MASTKDMADYVCDQLSGAGEITTKKMFGEYGLFCNGIYFGCICDNQLFIKPTATNVDLLDNPTPQAPYEGAKPCWLIEDLENRKALCALVVRTCMELPQPKRRKQTDGGE